MRICLVYDCLFPHTIGGAERWYRSLSERLAAEGHEVTYLTLRQWDRGADPGVPGVEVIAVGPRMALYTPEGPRRVAPPLVFGAGVLWHLLRNGRRYDVVHTCSFPYFSLLAAAAARRRGRYRLVVDWFEVWTRGYWREYLGRRKGDLGWRIQRLCARVPQRAFCFSRLYAERLRAEGLRGEITLLAGIYAGPIGARDVEAAEPAPAGIAEPTQAGAAAEPVVVFAGRHIPEKRVPSIVPAIALARAGALPGLRAEILGDGPERGEVLRLVDEFGLGDSISVSGFVSAQAVEQAIQRAMCLVLPSKREGYGLVLIEAAAHGTPSVVVADPDNAAVELVTEGVNGFIAPSASPEDLAAAIVRVHQAGPPLRESTAAWFTRNAELLSLERSLEIALSVYSGEPSARS